MLPLKSANFFFFFFFFAAVASFSYVLLAAALTVRNVASEAGCSTTGIYTYFGGKNGLVEAIFVEGFESFDAATAPFMEVDDLAGGCRAYREWALANPTQYMVMFGRAVPDFVPSGDTLGACPAVVSRPRRRHPARRP